MPKFLSGNLSDNSKLLGVLNMNAEKAREMVVSAREHHDLLQQLAPAFAPYKAVLDDAGSRYVALNAELEKNKEEIGSLIVKPVWDAWIGVLQQAVGLFEQNKNQIEAASKLVGDLIGNTAKLVTQAEQFLAKWSAVKAVAKYIYDEFVSSVAVIDVLVVGAQTLGNVLGAAGRAFWEGLKSGDFKTAFANFKKEAAQELSDFRDQANKIGTKAYDAISGKAQPTAKAPQKTGNLREVDDAEGRADRLAQLKKDYQEELASAKANEAEIRSIYENAVKSRTMADKEATDLIVASYQRESDNIDHISKKYIQFAKDIRGLKPKVVTEFSADINKNLIASNKTTTVGQNNAIGTHNAKVLAEQDKEYKETERAAVDHKRQMLQIAQQEAEAGFLTKEDVVQRERQLLEDEHNYEVSLLNREAQNANEFQLSDVNNRRVIENNKYTDSLLLNSAKRIHAVEDELQRQRDYALQMAVIDAQLSVEQARHTAAMTGSPYDEAASARYALTTRQAEAQLAYAMALREQAIAEAQGKQGAALDAIIRRAQEARNQWVAAKNAVDEAGTPKRMGQKNAVADIFGSEVTSANDQGQMDWSGTFDNMKESMSSFEGATALAANALQTLPQIIGNIVNAVKQGMANGGTLGGIGAGMTAIGAYIPGPVGSIVSAVGSAFSIIGGLFTAAAKKIAANIKKDVDNIMRDYNNGADNLVTTIGELEAKRAQAISQLSGKKGGQEQLDKLLPSIDDQIASLKKTQKDIIDTFNASLADLQLHSDTLGNIESQWRAINKQVKDYLDAGGSASNAAAFLQANLSKIAQDTKDSLNQGEQTAIQDAIQLNDLLVQRIKLTQDWQKTEFDTINADAIERRQSNAVSTGQQLAAKKLDYQTQLDALDEQISLTAQKVDKEKQVFQIATDTASLNRENDRLTLLALDEELSKMRDMQTILSSIAAGNGVAFGGTLGTVINNNSVNIAIDGQTLSSSDPAISKAASDLVDAIKRRSRVGY